MRWLVGHPGPQFSVADMFNGWVEALRGLGEDVRTFGLDDCLLFFDAALVEVEGVEGDHGEQAVRKALTRPQAVHLAADQIYKPLFWWWPDVLLLVSAFFIPAEALEVIRARGIRIVLLHSESPYQDDEQLRRAVFANVNLLNDPTNLAAYRELEGRAEYMPHAYRENVHYPAPPGVPKKYDLAFVGTGFDSRVKFFGDMDLAGLDVYLGGPWFGKAPIDVTDANPDGCIDNAETAEIYRQSRTGINFYRRESEDAHAGEGWAIGPREVEMAAVSLWFARDGRPESDELFPMLPSFSSPQEAGELIRWAVAHEPEREKAAAQAREAIADRTFENHARKLLALLDK